MTITKADIVKKIEDNFRRLGYSRPMCTNLVEQILEIMKRTMANGEDIMISGFGKFQVNEKKDRRGRNPATGDDLMLEPRRVVTFKCSGRLREKINGGKKFK
jgi:integration host factor subunit alpha